MHVLPVVRHRTPPTLPGVAAVLALGLALASPTTAVAQEHFPATGDVETMASYLVEDGETPGIVLGFIDEDGSTRIVHYGEAGPASRPLGPKSAFEIGSITKTFTAALLADMVARGAMALDDPVQDYLPEGVSMPAWDGREITLMDLSTHQSGLPRMPDNFDPADPDNPYADYGAEELYEFLNGHELRREPGSEFEYSNLGVGLLGHVLELATGKSYEALVRERILEPLDMGTTGVTLEGELAEWMTRGHDGAGEVVPHWDARVLAGAGMIRSSAEDMLAYLAAQMGPAESSIEQAMRRTHQVRDEGEGERASGLGWGIRELGDRRILSHGGGTAGYSTWAGFDPVVGVAVVMLTNTGDFDDDIGSDLLRRGAPIADPTVELPREALARFEGLYGPEPERAIAVRLEEEGWLTVQAPGNVRFRMYADSDTSFYVRRTPWRFTFQAGPTGQIAAVAADLEGDEGRMARLDAEVPHPRAVARNSLAPDDLPPLTAAEMVRYAGEYRVTLGPETLELRVFVEEGQLRARPAGQRSTRLVRLGEHTFMPAVDADARLVFQLEDGRAERVTFRDGPRTGQGRRVDPSRTDSSSSEVVEPELRDLPLAREERTVYEGTYRLEVGDRTMELRIFSRDGQLVSQATGQRVVRLRYQGDHVFVPDFDDRARLVFTVEEGRATGVTLHQGGGVFHGERSP